MKFGFFLFVSSVVVSSIYASSCYSVGLIDVRKSNASGLKERFHIPQECITPTIGRFVSVRCGCYDTTKEAKRALKKKYRKYKDASIVQTRRSRFSNKTSKPLTVSKKPKHKVIHKKVVPQKRVVETPQKVIEIPKDAQIDLVQIDPITGKLVVVKSSQESAIESFVKVEKPQPKKKVVKKVVHTKHVNKRKPIVHKSAVLQQAKPIPKKLLHTTPQKVRVTRTHIQRDKVDTIKDEKILKKLQALKPQLKKEPQPKKAFKIEEPKKLKPLQKHISKKEKKYFHEQDSEIADILEFIDSDEELDADTPASTKKDEDFFYDDFSEENDVYLDD